MWKLVALILCPGPQYWNASVLDNDRQGFLFQTSFAACSHSNLTALSTMQSAFGSAEKEYSLPGETGIKRHSSLHFTSAACKF
ncbi:hypothetical protein D918_07031 [Trichuris suis]|nr:hypothetical protein D918_07031 [Trichuris suis]